MLDGNALATGHAFYKIGTFAVSRDGKLARVGRGHGRPQPVRAAHQEPRDRRDAARHRDEHRGAIAWANDNKTLFYVGKDEVTLRNDRVFRHVLGGAHELVYREDDGQYYMSIGEHEVATATS